MAAIHAHRRAISSPSGADADVLAYLSATGIPNTGTAYYGATAYATTGAAMWASADTFIRGLKSNGLWTRIQVLYPMLGGTAGSHAVNAKTPGTNTLAYRNAPAHTGQGIRFNPAATQLADTGFTSVQLVAGQGAGMDYYSQDNTTIAGDVIEMGAVTSGDGILLGVRDTDVGGGQAVGRAANGGAFITSTSVTSDTRGLFSVNRTVAGIGTIRRNGAAIGSDFTTAAMPTNLLSLTIGALAVFSDPIANGAYAPSYTNRGCALACIRGGFTIAEMTTYYNLVQAFQAANFRAV